MFPVVPELLVSLLLVHSTDIIITIFVLVITSMQGIYNYTPETNHVYSVNNVAAVLCLQFVLHAMLFRK